MEKEQVFNILKGIFAEVLKKDDFTFTYLSTAADIDGWDSLTNMKIVAQTEMQFDCKFNFREVSKLKNVGDLCELVASKKSIG